MGQCPKCGTAFNDGDVFCGTCGMDLRPVAQPTAQMPPQPYPGQPAYQPQPYPGQQPPKQKRPGLVIGIVAGVLVLCGLCSVAGIVGYLRFMPVKNVVSKVSETTPTPTATEEPSAEEPGEATEAPATGFASAEEAVKAQLPKGWQYKLAENDGDSKEYWIGPPASEWADALTVEKGAGGGWAVTSSKPLGGDGEASEGESSEAESSQAAIDVVKRFNTLIQQDKPLDAQKLTIDPFRSDGASAQYSNGEFLSFKVDKAVPAGDGTYWVYVTQKWKSGTERWKYHAVTTEAGYRINELTAP